jgi:hypothetical protein
LPSDPQRIPDLLPGPPLTAGDRHLVCLDALRDPAQRQSGTQSLGRVLRPDRFCDFIDVDAVSLR